MQRRSICGVWDSTHYRCSPKGIALWRRREREKTLAHLPFPACVYGHWGCGSAGGTAAVLGVQQCEGVTSLHPLHCQSPSWLCSSVLDGCFSQPSSSILQQAAQEESLVLGAIVCTRFPFSRSFAIHGILVVHVLIQLVQEIRCMCNFN